MANTEKKGAATRKFEVRSRTNAPYRRAGHAFNPGWNELSPEVVGDEKTMMSFLADPHLDFRVDGRRISKETGKPIDDDPTDTAVPIKEMRATVRDLRSENEELKTRLTQLDSLQTLQRENEMLRQQLAAREPGTKAPTEPAPPEQKSAPTISSEGQQPTPLAPTAPATSEPKNAPKK